MSIWYVFSLAQHIDLFNDMDQQTNLGLINYGVTMTTLEDVFLRLEGNENMKEEGKVLFSILYYFQASF